jgi:hypothetical protein
MPVTYWEQTSANVDWTGPTAVTPAQDAKPTGTSFTFIWKSPTFDLRPDLRSGDGQAKEGIPIWSRFARLRFALRDVDQSVAITGAAMQNMTVRLQHHGNALSGRPGNGNGGPNTIVALTPLITVTNAFTFGAGLDQSPPQSTALATFAPPGTGAGGGEGYPLRYWQVRLTFTKTYETAVFPNAAAGPPLSFNAVCY